MPSVAGARVALSNVLLRLTPRARFSLVIALVALVLLGVSYSLSRPSATLSLVCRHDFRKGEITVAIDDDVVHTATLTGATVKRWLGVVEQTQGTYTATLPVRSGNRTVQVHLRAPGYDRTRATQAMFRPGRESTLVVDAGRGLTLSWRDSRAERAGAPSAASSPAWITHAGSILLTIFGSIVSASIGVVVQDFLRSRKAAFKEAATAPPPRSPKD